MSIFTKYIQNEEHYSDVISRIMSVRNNLWIGTADIKDVYVKQDGETIPLLGQEARRGRASDSCKGTWSEFS